MFANQPPIPHSPRGNSSILPQSKIKNPQSSFINPIFLHRRIVLVQFNSMGDPDNGGRFTVKKYHSAKTVARPALLSQISASQLLSLSAFTPPVVVGEWVASID